jgi:hypothetical protein
MYRKTTLVEQDVRNGGNLIEALRNRLPMLAAFWVNTEEAGEWRLTFISPLISEGEAHLAFRTIRQVLSETGISIPMDNIAVMSEVNLHYKHFKKEASYVPSGRPVRGFAPADNAEAYVYFVN